MPNNELHSERLKSDESKLMLTGQTLKLLTRKFNFFSIASFRGFEQ